MFDLNHAAAANEKICLECNREFTGIISNCPHDNSVLFSRTQDPFVGTTLAGNYEIQSVIGHGGMGVVYKARHKLMDRIVAIKMLHPQLVSHSMSVKRFQQEVKAASRVKHPHVITVYEFDISQTGQPYLVMDYLEGDSLADALKKEGNIPVERAIRILKQTCDALEHAHKEGVVHRDLKPTNIVLCKVNDEVDFVKVVDFGVAKLMNSGTEGQRLTQAGEVCGSPVYMSPEQCMGMDLDRRSDIYSMGVVIYETLTGRLPILGRTMVDTMTKHISDVPTRFKEARPDLYIPERLEAVVFKALAKDPKDRHQTMNELMNDLDVAIPKPGRSEVLRSVPSAGQYSVKSNKSEEPKKPILPIAIGAAVVGVVGLGGVVMMMSSKPKPAPPAVQQPVAAAITKAPDAKSSDAKTQDSDTAKASATGTAIPSTADKPANKPVEPPTSATKASAPSTTPPVAATHAAPVAHAAPPAPPHVIKPKKPAHAPAKPAAAAPAPKADPFSELRNEHSWNR